jgi:hypothetical protein
MSSWKLSYFVYFIWALKQRSHNSCIGPDLVLLQLSLYASALHHFSLLHLHWPNSYSYNWVTINQHRLTSHCYSLITTDLHYFTWHCYKWVTTNLYYPTSYCYSRVTMHLHFPNSSFHKWVVTSYCYSIYTARLRTDLTTRLLNTWKRQLYSKRKSSIWLLNWSVKWKLCGQRTSA